MGQIEERLGAIAKLIQTDQDADALRLHLGELIGSPAFSSSRRSGQFLQYVVEKAVAQQTDALKERTIGAEVFHRPPDYDTGEDAIVRVTATDVRRRLAQHYSLEGRYSCFRISLPPGGYAPEIYRDPPAAVAPTEERVSTEPEVVSPSGSRSLPDSVSKTSNDTQSALSVPTVMRSLAGGTHRAMGRGVFLLLGLAATFLFLCTGFLLLRQHREAVPQLGYQAPWSLLFAPGKPLLVVMADPDLNEIQKLTGKYVSLSDYAAGKLGCETLHTDLQTICKHSLRGDKSSTVDVAAVTKLAALAGLNGVSIEPLETRSVRLPDLQTDRNIVMLGSRVSNPWIDLFRDKVDFYIGHDDLTDLQVVYNTHRRTGEADEYIPTAGPYGSGDNYTLITFLHNLHGKGYALLVSGATHEGMDAAMEFTMDASYLAKARQDCGIHSAETPFQMLLKFKMMAGSPLQITSITCHRLAGQV